VALDTDWRYTHKNRITTYVVFTAVIMESIIIIRDVTPCSLVEVYGRFGGTNCHHLHGQIFRVKQTTSKKESAHRVNCVCRKYLSCYSAGNKKHVSKYQTTSILWLLPAGHRNVIKSVSLFC
jgi:hypothetical protein